jgi:tetratricopeptide (TPR) repeat protein
MIKLNGNSPKETLSKAEIEKLCKSCSKSFKIAFNKKFSPKSAKQIFDFLLKKEEEHSEQIDQYSKKLFSYGRVDLEASEILYNKGFNALAIYHLQQSIEKITKAYFLYSSLIKLENLKSGNDSIRHITPKALTLSLKDLDFRKNVELLFKVSNLDKKDLDKDIKNMEKLIEKQENLAVITSSEINHLLKDFNIRYKMIKRVNMRELRYKAGLFAVSFLNNIQKFFGNKGEIDKLRSALEDFKKLPKKQIELNFLLMNLYVFSLISFPHFAYTRYPKEDKSDLEPEDYNSSLGIVHAYPDILRSMKSVIKGIENVHKELK